MPKDTYETGIAAVNENRNNGMDSKALSIAEEEKAKRHREVIRNTGKRKGQHVFVCH